MMVLHKQSTLCDYDDDSIALVDELPFCACGCGQRVERKGNTFIKEHVNVGRVGRVCSEVTKRRIGDANKNPSDETRRRMSRARTNPSDETRRRMSRAQRNKSVATRQKLAKAATNPSAETLRLRRAATVGQTRDEEQRKRMSAGHQGIDIKDWTEYATESPYCEKFNQACREKNREKYDRLCFICGKTEKDNGARLSVHHVDMNKQQGCDDHEWQLVPLCKKHHGKSHSALCQARIKYLLKDTKGL